MYSVYPNQNQPVRSAVSNLVHSISIILTRSYIFIFPANSLYRVVCPKFGHPVLSSDNYLKLNSYF